MKDFVDCIDWQEGKGMSLVKINLLNHFIDCIWMHRSAMIFNGAIGELYLKTKQSSLPREPKWTYKIWNTKLL